MSGSRLFDAFEYKAFWSTSFRTLALEQKVSTNRTRGIQQCSSSTLSWQIQEITESLSAKPPFTCFPEAGRHAFAGAWGDVAILFCRQSCHSRTCFCRYLHLFLISLCCFVGRQIVDYGKITHAIMQVLRLSRNWVEIRQRQGGNETTPERQWIGTSGNVAPSVVNRYCERVWRFSVHNGRELW